MKVYNKHYIDFETLSSEEQKKKKGKDLFVILGDELVSILDLYIVTKTGKSGEISTRKVRDLSDFKRNLEKENVYRTESGDVQLDSMSTKLVVKSISIPARVDSISINKTGARPNEEIPYGLKRTLKVERDESKSNESYLYVKINNKWNFLRKNQIFWYDGLKKKTYNDAISEGKDLSEISFFDEFNHEIKAVYTEYEYKFGSVIARESVNIATAPLVDIPPLSKKTYYFNDDGIAVYSSVEINKYVSDQRFETQTVADEKRPGKTKQVSKVKVVNYQISEFGDYVAIKVNNQIKMVKLEDLVDEDGKKITDLSKLIGKRVKIKQGDKTIETSEPLTYEQANLLYSKIKTYQATNNLPTENSCLRLIDGTYVKELETVQPTSFRVVSDSVTNFDKYLVEQTIDGVKKFVVVDKDYFKKKGGDSSLDISTAKRLTRCGFNDKSCSVVQTTSKDENIEQCAIVGKIAGLDIETAKKDEIYQGFKTGYIKCEYKIEDVYLAGKRCKFDKGRYEYTDTAYFDDHADTLHQYQSIKASPMQIKDGKYVGGAKFDVGKGIAASYSVWSKALAAGVTMVPSAGVLGLLAVPLVSVYAVGVLVALPVIPIVNIGIGFVKNIIGEKLLREKAHYKDKTEYNRKVDSKEIQKELDSLIINKGALNETQFNDVYNNILNNIIRFSATTNNETFSAVDGKVEVNSNNANLINRYINDYNKVAAKFETCKKKVEKLKKKGKAIPAELQAEFDALETQFNTIKNETRGQSYGKDERLSTLQTQAAFVKIYMLAKHYKNPEMLTVLGDKVVNSLEYDAKLGLTIYGVSILQTDKKLEKTLNKKGINIPEWYAIRNKLLTIANENKEIQNKNPNTENVEGTLTENLSNIENIKELMSQIDEIINISLSMLKNIVDAEQKEIFEINLKNIKDTADSNYSYSINECETAEDFEHAEEIMKDCLEEAKGLNEQIINQNKLTIIDRVESYLSNALKNIDSVADLKISSVLSGVNASMIVSYEIMVNIIREIKKPETTLEVAIELNNKAVEIEKLIAITSESLSVAEELVKSGVSPEKFSEPFRLLSSAIEVDETTTLDSLKEKNNVALNIYETSILILKLTEVKKTDDKKPQLKIDKGQEKNKPLKRVEEFNTKIVSEDRLVVLLKAKLESKDRKKLISYIIEKSGVEISEDDIKLVIDRINENHIKKPPKSATAYASRLSNKNILYILEYGQEYLTKYATEIKERTSEHSV